MDQETAKRLLLEGATLIFLDVPEGSEFGVDMKSWNTCENFRGVKMIPPGIHYVFYSSVSGTGDTAPRSGFFHNFRRAEVVARKWDGEAEDISSKDIDEKDVVNFKDNITALDKFLGPYPYDVLDRWTSLTSHITDELISKLMPTSGEIRSALELISCTDSDRPRGRDSSSPAASGKSAKRSRLSNSSDDMLDNLLPDLKPKPGTELRFTSLPSKTYPDGSTPSQITRHCLDCSYALDVMLSNYTSAMDIIGELEFSYVCFLVGHSLEAFEHWKDLVGLLCSCETAIKKYRVVYDAFVSVLEVQVREIPEDFLADIVSNNNFVYAKLRELFRAVRSSDADGRLKSKMERFKNNLTNSFNWDFTHLESEDEEDAPVLVYT